MVQVKNGWYRTCQWCKALWKGTLMSLGLLLIGASLYGMYLVMFWWNDHDPIVTYGLGEVSVPQVRPNEVIIIHQAVKKTRNCWGSVQRVLVGECGFFIVSEAPAWVLAPWEGRLTYAVQIPPEAIPGNCGFQVIGRFICNPFDLFGQPRLSASTPIPFKVLRFDE